MNDEQRTKRQSIPARRTWLYIAGMFVLLCILAWLNEIVDFPHLLLGAPRTPINWHEAAIEMVLIASVGLLVVLRLARDVTERKQAEEETRQRTAQLEALRQVGLEITAELDLDSLLHFIVSRAVELVGGESGGLYLYRPDLDVLVWVMAVGPHLAPIGTILHRGEGLSGKVWETGESLIVGDYRHWEGRAAIYEGYPWTAIVAVPVRWGEEFLGVLNVLADPPHTFSPADAELLGLFATQAAIAIRNAQLYEDIRQRALEQETVSRIAYALNTPDVRDAFPALVKGLQDLTGCDLVNLIAMDEAGEQFIVSVLESPFPIPGEGEAMLLSATAAAENVEAGRPHLTADLSAEIHFPLEQVLYQAGLRSQVTLPLLVGGEVFGALNLGGTRPGLFREDQLPVLRQIADAVALAFENSLLFQTEREQRQLAKALEEATAALTATLDFDQVLDRILEQVSRVVPNDATNIMLLPPCERGGPRGGGDQVRIVRWRGYERFGAEEFVSTVVFRIPEVANLQQMLESREPMVIPDTATYTGWVHIPVQAWLRSYAAAPIVVRGEVAGFLNVDSATPGFFTQADAEALRAFADHAAAAIENARLYEETRQRTETLAALHEIALDLAAQRALPDLLRALVVRASDLLAAKGGAIYLYRPATDDLELALDYNPWVDQSGTVLKRGEGLSGRVLETGQPIAVADYSRWEGRSAQFEGAGFTAVVAVPIFWGDRPLGVLDVVDDVPRAFSSADIALLERFAPLAAAALEEARLLEEERTRRREAEALRQAATVLSSTLELGEVLELILQQLRQVIPYDSASIQQLQDEHLEIVACQGFEEPDKVVGLVFPLDPKFPNHHVITTKAPLAVEDVVEDYPHFKNEADTYESGRIRSWLGVPLMVKDEVIGMIAVDRAEVRPYTAEEAQLAMAFANQAAIAIENARLFEESEERRMYLEGVLGSAPDAIVTLDAQHRIVEWNLGAERLYGYSREEVIGRDIDPLVTNPETIQQAREFRQIVMGGKDLPPVETVRYRKDGSPVHVIVAASPILVGDELIGIVTVYTDITARKRAEDMLRALLLIDELTGLYNRRGFFTLGQRQLKMADRTKKRMVLLFADFDYLKGINDAFGHPEGDRALIEVADVLTGTFRESDIIGRIGGDEFVVLATETDESSVEILATRLQENLEARNAKGGLRYRLSLSVGIARYDPKYPCSMDQLLTRADRAMYEQKQRNQKITIPPM